MNPNEFTPLPSFTRSTLPDAAANTILRDVPIIIVENDGSRGVWISNGLAWVQFGGSGSSALAALDISGAITLNSATHGNRHLSWTGAAPVTLTMGTGTAGDIMEVTNDGTAPITFAGLSAASLAAGNKSWLLPGETLGAVYSAGNWDSVTQAPPWLEFSGRDVTVPLDTVQNTVVNQAVPGGAMGANGRFEIEIWCSRAAAGVGTYSLKPFYGAKVIDDIHSVPANNLAYHLGKHTVMNDGAENAQFFITGNMNESQAQGSVQALDAGTIDTSAAWNFQIKTQNASVETQVIKIRKWILKIWYRP